MLSWIGFMGSKLIGGLTQERLNSSALAMELCLSCTNLLTCPLRHASILCGQVIIAFAVIFSWWLVVIVFIIDLTSLWRHIPWCCLAPRHQLSQLYLGSCDKTMALLYTCHHGQLITNISINRHIQFISTRVNNILIWYWLCSLHWVLNWSSEVKSKYRECSMYSCFSQ